MSSTPTRRVTSILALLAAALLGACGGDSGGDSPTGPGPDPDPAPAPQPQPQPEPGPSIQGRVMFGLTCNNGLVQFGSANPGTIARHVAITGMPAGASMLGIDFRSTGALYGVGSDSRVYTIDTLSGAASPVGGGFSPTVSGEHFGLAYNATDDRLRLVSVEGNQNLSLDPASGAVASADPDLAFAASDPNAGANPGISGAAYDTAGTLYGIDTNANALVRVTTATGEITTVAPFGFNVYLCSGFDIDADGTGYATLSTDAGSEVYTIDLASGATTLLGQLPGAVHSLAVAP
jgi:hypothetical protein